MRQLWITFDRITTWSERRAARIIFSVVGLYFTYAQLANLSKDTTLITNAAFAMTASLAALCFSYARALDGAADIRSRVVHAGERFFHAAVLLITASLIKYLALALVKFESTRFWQVVIFLTAARLLGFLALLLFVRALMFADTGISQITNILWDRPRKRLWEVDP
jgi:hypothetical protein